MGTLFQKLSLQQSSSLIAYFEDPSRYKEALRVFSETLQLVNLKAFKKENKVLLAQEITATFLPIAKERYQTTMRAIDQTLISIGIKNHPTEKLTKQEVFSFLVPM